MFLSVAGNNKACLLISPPEKKHIYMLIIGDLPPQDRRTLRKLYLYFLSPLNMIVLWCTGGFRGPPIVATNCGRETPAFLTTLCVFFFFFSARWHSSSSSRWNFLHRLSERLAPKTPQRHIFVMYGVVSGGLIKALHDAENWARL